MRTLSKALRRLSTRAVALLARVLSHTTAGGWSRSTRTDELRSR